MKNERIRLTVFMPLGLALTALLAAALFAVYRLQRRNHDDHVAGRLAGVQQMFDLELKEDAELMAGLAEMLVRNNDLHGPFLAADRDKLLQAARPIFQRLRSQHRVTHFYFHRPDKTCFLRVHNPLRHGDHIDRTTMAGAARAAKAAHGIELGPLGTFTLRVVQPWRVDGRLVGYIELGEEIRHVTSGIKEVLGTELVFVINKRHLRRADWEEGMRMLGRAANWDRFEQFVVTDCTMQRTPEQLDRLMQQGHAAHGDAWFDFTVGDRQYRGGFLPLADAAGRDVGDMVALVDLTQAKAALGTLLAGLISAGVAVAAVLGGTFWVFLGRVQRRLADARDELRSQVRQGRRNQADLQRNQTSLEQEIQQRRQAENALEKQIIELVQARRAAVNMMNDLERENAERKRAEQTAKESWKKYKTLFQASADGILITDVETRRFQYANPAVCRLLGYSEEEIQRLGVPDVHPKDKLEAVIREFEMHARGEKDFVEGLPFLRKDGSVVYVDVSGTAAEIDGRLCSMGFLRDVTQRKLAEEKLRASEEKLRTISDAALDAVIMMDSDGNVVHWNPAAQRIFGYSPGEILGRNLHQTLGPPKYRPQAERAVAEFVRSGRGAAIGNTIELEGLRKDGSLFPIEIAVSPINVDGRWWAVAILKDITQRRRAEEQLKKLSLATQQSPATVVITDTQGTIEYVNPRFTEITGYTAEEAIGQNPRILKSGDMPPEAYRELWETILAGKVWRGEFHNKRKNGELFWEAASISPITGPNGEITHFVAVKEDVTERRQADQDLKDYAEALESANITLEQFTEAAQAANRAKSEFLANMSHEIRTPMTAVLGFTDVLLEEESRQHAPPERIKALETIRRNGTYLLELINDILDLSKIESGKLEVERIDCSPAQLVADVARLMQVRSDAKNLPLVVEYVGAVPETIRSDPTRLRQILINLTGNAIKFTETGSVRLVTRLVRSTGRPPCLLFDVIDTGIGMTNDQATRLFRPFTQADSSTSRKFGGTGLGLTISKRLAEMLGGDISVSSSPARGSTFSVTIQTGPLDGLRMLDDPAKAAADARAESKPHAKTRIQLAGRVLLAEDAPDNQRLLSFLLKKVGLTVTLAENGQIARDKALAAGHSAEPFDLILMDMQMPILDGYEATRLLRQAGYTGPIIALTANTMAGDREKCLQAGCDDYAAKPIDHEKFLPTIARHLQASQETAVE